MFAGVRFGSAWQFARIALTSFCLVAGAGMVSAVPQSQSPQAVQTGPIDEPRGGETSPSGPPIVKGKQAIRQIVGKCSTTISVNVSALFETNRWTLNPDAAQTMDILGPMIAKAGKHPVRIASFTGSTHPDNDDLSVSQKRALTVRGWLVNHGYVVEGTPVEGFGKRNPAAPNSKPDGSDNSEGRQKNRRVDIMIDTCGELK